MNTTAVKKLLELTNISAGYNGEIVVKNANIEIFSDDFIGIIGPNGGGKTTLVKVILGLIKPKTGTINYSFNNQGGQHSIGYLPQINQIDNKFPITVLDVVLSGLMNNSKLVKRFSKDEKKLAELLLEQMGIIDLKRKAIGELSGGQLQRIFLCRSIISSPELLILDEPNVYVDNQFEGELYQKLGKLNQNMAILIVSHDIGTISTYIKSIVCVNREVHYHKSNIISQEQLKSYNCPIQLITHGDVPHTVLHQHKH